MARSIRLGAALWLLARLGLASCVACAVVSGLDQLNNVPCVAPCADDAAPSDGAPKDDASHPGDATASGDGKVDATGGPDAEPSDSGAVDSGDSALHDAGNDADAQTCAAPITGLLGHWTMDVSSINGTTLSDISGNHKDGTLIDFTAPVTAAGHLGEALAYPLDATADFQVPLLPLDAGPGGVNTISMWFYRSGPTVDELLLVFPNSPRYDLWLTDQHGAGGAPYLCFNTGNGECVGFKDTTLFNRWVHVAAIFVNGLVTQDTIFVDGKSRAVSCLQDAGFASCTSLSGLAGSPFDFAGRQFPFHGMLDDVRIYNRALTAAEVLAIYDGTACP
jgi:hypothetical protein